MPTQHIFKRLQATATLTFKETMYVHILYFDISLNSVTLI